MKFNLITTSIFTLLILFSTSIFAVESSSLKLKYNKKNGSFSVYQDKNVIIKDAVSIVELSNHITLKSDDAASSRKFEKRKFQDGLGQGDVHTYISKFKSGIDLKQHFYLYKNMPYFILQVEVIGENISSNKIVAIHSESVVKHTNKDLYHVIVPFDNDEFISYENKALTKQGEPSSEVGMLLNKNSAEGLLIASLDQSTWKSGINFYGENDQVNQIDVIAGFTNKHLTKDEMPHGTISGQSIYSPKYFIYSGQNWREGMEQFGHFHRFLTPKEVQPWTQATPVGWNSWGVIQEKLSFKNATANVDFFKNQIPGFRNENGEAYIDLDSFWDNMTPGGMLGDYTKLKEFVDYCKANGLKPGVYFAPFTDWGFSRGANRKVDGSDYTYGDIWTKTKNGYHDLDGGRAIDPTHPGTQKRIELILKKLVDCGFEMIKIDFLTHGSIESLGFYDPKVTTGMQAYYAGMKHIVDVLDNKMLIYAAISPSLASSPFVHMRRIACDAWGTIDQTQYTLNSISYAWWQTYVYDFIDADHLVFKEQPLAVNKTRLLSAVVAGPIILGDDLSAELNHADSLKAWLQNKDILAIGKDGKSFRPIGFVEGKSANNLYVKKTDKYLYVAAMNFSSDALQVELNLNEFGLQSNKKYEVTELLENVKAETTSAFSVEFDGIDGKLFRITL